MTQDPSNRKARASARRSSAEAVAVGSQAQSPAVGQTASASAASCRRALRRVHHVLNARKNHRVISLMRLIESLLVEAARVGVELRRIRPVEKFVDDHPVEEN